MCMCVWIKENKLLFLSMFSFFSSIKRYNVLFNIFNEVDIGYFVLVIFDYKLVVKKNT